jgi:CrcB protein
MGNLLLVFLGGGLGSVARWQTGVLATRSLGLGWPWGTLTVNVVGGFLMGVLAGWLAHRGGADQERWRVMIGVGILGGFTTFSSFSLETALMIERRQYLQAGSYALASVVLAVTALFVGLLLARRIFA